LFLNIEPRGAAASAPRMYRRWLIARIPATLAALPLRRGIGWR